MEECKVCNLYNLDFKSFFAAIGSGFSSVTKMLSPVFESLSKVIGSINFDTLFGLIKAGSAIEMVKQLKGMFEEISDTGESAKTFLDKVVKSFTSFSDLGKSIIEYCKRHINCLPKRFKCFNVT